MRYLEGETSVKGSSIGLPFVDHVASIRSHCCSRITWHSHASYELLFLLEGSTGYELDGGENVRVDGGSFLVIPPGCRHRGMHDLRKPAWMVGIIFSMHGENSKPIPMFSESEFAWLSVRYSGFSRQAYKMGTELKRLVQAIALDFSSIALSNVPLVASLRMNVCSILLESARRLDSDSFTPCSLVPMYLLESATRFMLLNLSESLPVETVAEAVKCSRATLFELFKESTGLTPNDYWQRLRIDRAQELLLKSEKSITEIALECGFSSSQYFSSVFRKYAGATPSSYRRSPTAS